MTAILLFGVLVLAQVSPQAPSPDQKCVVAGRIVNAQTGEPLKKATVHLMRAPTAQADFVPGGYTTTSDAEGNFRFEDIEPGKYTVSGERIGFLHTIYRHEGGIYIQLSAGQQIRDVSIALPPQGVVSGKVLDEDGDPAPNAAVQLLHPVWNRRRLLYGSEGEVHTNDLGEFRLDKVRQGKYYLCEVRFQPLGQQQPTPGGPDIRPIRTCYPDATSIAASTPIQIATGQELAGINIRMRNEETFHVRGKIAGDLSSDDVARVVIRLSESDNPSMFASRGAGITKDRTFDIPGVAAGSYTLEVYIFGTRSHSVGHQSVKVSGEDVDVIVTLLPPGSIQGSIHVEGTPSSASDTVDLASIHIELSFWNPFGLVFGGLPQIQAKSDGTFSLENIAPDDYELRVLFPSNKVYLKSTRFGAQEIIGGELDLRHGASGNLDITLRYGLAEVEAITQSGARIFLVPETLHNSSSGPFFGGIVQTGPLAIPPIRPGRYRAYAFEQIDRVQLENPEVLGELEPLGTEVELKENDKKQIQLTMIPATQIQQILAHLGIDSAQ